MRTRFPPSPTGLLHVGGLRTALYTYILAKQKNGTFLIRIEDTDREREVPGAIENIVANLAWAGIVPDEGVMLKDGVVTQTGPHAPYLQSERMAKGIYKKYADELVKKGHAYPCFCTSVRLEEMRKQQEQRHQAPMYDRHCLELPGHEIKSRLDAGEPHVIRLKVPHERVITFSDDIRGPLSFQGHTVDDQVLLKSDGFPTYHLAHVVDDHLMEIDLVTRGEEWLSSLPKHLLLFEFLGWPVPRYAHVPLLLNADKTKLSKRQNSVSVDEYRNKGYLPEALLNFLALLGWNPGTTQEIFSLKELTEQFDLARVQKAGAIFDLTKLDWLQGQWMRKFSVEEFAARIKPIVTEKFPAAAQDSDFLHKAGLIQERITFFHEAPDMLSYFYSEPAASRELMANKKQKVTDELLPEILNALIATLENMDAQKWSEESLKAALMPLTEGTNAHSTPSGRSGHFSPAGEKWKLGQILWPLRAALTGRDYSPGAFEVAAALGKEKTMERLLKAKNVL